MRGVNIRNEIMIIIVIIIMLDLRALCAHVKIACRTEVDIICKKSLLLTI